MVHAKRWEKKQVVSRPWRVGLFDFGSGSGRVWPKSSGFGFGFGYCAYYDLDANSLVILYNSISCKGAEFKSECFVILIMLTKNWNIICKNLSLQSTAMPFIQKKSVVPKKKASKVWRIFKGDTLETILIAPLQSVFCARTTQLKVTPTCFIRK